MDVRALGFAAVLAAAPALASAQPADPAQVQAPGAVRAPRSARGVGVVVEIDAPGQILTLRHEPIPALGWPQMTMPFHVANPELFKGLKVGQKVAFDTREDGGLPLITAIRKP